MTDGAGSWDTHDLARRYEEKDDATARVFGYPFTLRAAGVGDPGVRRILDVGCGPGIVAERTARRFGVEVIAADPSASMIRVARGQHSHALVDYHEMVDERLGFMPDDSVDAAICCFVLISIASLDRIRALMAEVHRVLRPRARLAVMDSHPGSVGVQFADFRSGDPGHAYQPGELRPAYLERRSGGIVVVNNYFWPQSTYSEVLQAAGFADVHYLEPMLVDARGVADPTDLERYPWEMERTRPPYLIVVGSK